MSNNKKSNLSKKAIALISVMVILAGVGGIIAANKVLNRKQIVEGGYKETAEKTEETINDTVENNKDNTDVSKESSGKVEDSAYLEKYIGDQVKGIMPTGADGKKVAYLTFDDGPSKTVTPKILEILKKEKVNATFFVVGKYVDSDKNLVKRESDEGNTVGIHSYSHDYDYLFPGGKISVENCMSDFQKTEDSIKGILGQDYTVRALRFPGGYYSWEKNDQANAQAVSKQLHEKDWHQIDWNALSGDAEGNGQKTADQLYQEAVQTIGTREKAVILMHDTYGKEATAEALPRIIEYLKSQGYEFKTIQ